MVTTESLVDSVMSKWLPLNFPIQASPFVLALFRINCGARIWGCDDGQHYSGPIDAPVRDA